MAAEDPIHERCLLSCGDVVTALCPLAGATGIVPDLLAAQVYQQLLPDELNVVFPCVLITTEGEQEEEGDSSFEDDYVIYPVRILICDRTSGRDHQRRKVYLKWRRQLMAAFRARITLDDVSECHDIRVKGQVIVDPRLPAYQHLVTGFVVRCFTNEARTPHP